MEIIKKFDFFKSGIYMNFAVDENKRLLILNAGTSKKEIEPNRFFMPAEIFISGENPNDHCGAKHTGSLLSDSLQYVSHRDTDNEIVFFLKNDKIEVRQHYEFFTDASAVRSYAEIKNVSNDDIGLEYASSFCLYGFEFNKVWLCHNAWCRELEWRCYTPQMLGFNHITPFSTKRIAVSNTGTWSSKEYMPMGMLQNDDESIFWQIEHNGSWNFEISDIQGVNYIKLSGPSEQENSWWKELKPNETFETVKTATAFSSDFNGAIAEMTNYRKHFAYKSPADTNLPVIFNDYMRCLNADPTTEKEIAVIDAAAQIGAEIYCMDAGWYADGTWWETVGEWKVCNSRFPGGIKKVFDYIRSKGMKPGIWLEPESIGIKCPILNQFTDDCFFVRHGKRVINHGRYSFDFTNKKVTNFLDGVVDGLIRDLGIEYFKFDYNIEGGSGTEINSSSFGDGLMKHQAAYLEWIDGIYARHPNIIIENCASGGMRMDFKSLTHFTMQSLTDASNYKHIASIAAMSPTAVIARQAQVWVVPFTEHTNSEIAFSMVNSLFKRPVISGETHLLNSEQLKIIKDGIKIYKSIRSEIPNLIPFYPIGTANFESDWIVCGYKGGSHIYIVAQRLGGESESINIPLNCNYTNAQCIYPSLNNAPYSIKDGILTVTLKTNSSAVIKIS